MEDRPGRALRESGVGSNRRSCLLLVVSIRLLLGQAGALACTPATSPDVETEISHLQQLTNVHPDDPVLLYNLAVDFAQKCDTPTTLKLLQQVAEAKGGLDPAEYRGFAYLRDNPEFKAIVAAIRAKNQPRLQSKPAFVIKEPNLFPEGMACARYSGRVYAGSVQRKIVWTDRTGAIHDLVKAGEDNLAYVAGLHVDEARKELWAVSSKFGDQADLSNAIQGLFKYDLTTGRRIGTYVAPNRSAGYLNDVAVVPSTGNAYVTNTLEGCVYSTKTGSQELELFLPPGTAPGANGIAVSDDEKALFVAGDFEIYRIDLRTRSSAPLQKASDVIDASLDGLYFYRQSLVGIQNGIHPGRVVRFYLDPTLTRITRSEILETYNPAFENPTTGTLDGDSFLFMANTQLHKWQPGKPLPPPKDLHDIQILRITLAPP
jgi:sugar lactone lactonase YvrE